MRKGSGLAASDRRVGFARRFSRRVRTMLSSDHRRAERRGGLRREVLRAPEPLARLEWLWLDATVLHAVGRSAVRRLTRNGAPAWPAPGPAPAGTRFRPRQLAAMLRARQARLARSAPDMALAHLHVLGLAGVFGGGMIRRALGAEAVVEEPASTAIRIRALTDSFGSRAPGRQAAFMREGRWAFRLGAEALRVLSCAGRGMPQRS